MTKVSINVPASTANVGPGYDVFGIALTLYNTITIEESEKLEIIVCGNKADDSISKDKTNLVYQSIEAYYNHIKKPFPSFKITIDCQIPLASGLGSSSTAIVGGIVAANKYENNLLSIDDLITLAWKIEGHPDNTTTAILGGFVISKVTDEKTVAYKKLLWPEKWKIIICHPDFKLSTQEARAVIPKTIPLSDTIYNMSNCSFLVSAVCSGDDAILKQSLRDKLHQPYRSKLVPGMETIIHELKKSDALGTVLSGAGPSICIIAYEKDLQEISSTIQAIWQKEGISSEIFHPSVDNQGVY